MRKRAWIALGGLVAVVVLACSGGGDGQNNPSPSFERDCKVRGGHVVSERRGHGITKVCVPPAGGWQ
jgi:hypothetical protein